MKINIITVGKLNNNFQEICNSYVKKIEFYSSVNMIELKEIKEKNIDIKIKKETELILSNIPKNSHIFLCDSTGTSKTSKQFSEVLNKSNLTFIIGGSNGVYKSSFSNKISFSKMTFPHKLFKVFLLEQIFRGFSILNGTKYHK